MGSVTKIYALLTSVSALVLSSAAAAQTAPNYNAVTTSEVVVTGSRVSNGNNLPTPTTVVDVEQMQVITPGPIALAIEELPSLAGSRLNTGNPGSGTTNSAAFAFNLRNLGYGRVLVLLDGNRFAPSTYDQIVDGGNIPQMLLRKIDIVTGGASAVYGSDAVSGVINFVTDNTFNGLKIDLSAGLSDYGDDRRINGGIAAGTKVFADRGHVEVSFEYSKDPGIDHRSSRPWGAADWGMLGAGTESAPLHLVRNARFSTFAYGGLISGATGAGSALNGKFFKTNGGLATFDAGTPVAGQAGYASGGDGTVWDGSLATALTSKKIFSRFDYEITPTVHAYVQGAYTNDHVLSFSTYNVVSNLVFSGQNGFLPVSNQFSGNFKLSEHLQQMPRVDTNTNQKQYFIVGGLSGSIEALGKKYAWELHVQHASALATTRNDQNVNNQKLYAALDAVTVTSANVGTTGQALGSVVCHVALTNPGLYPGCVPLNVFGPTAASPTALAYIRDPTQYTVDNRLDNFNGTITGSPFSLRAGPVTMAITGEYRRQSLSVVSSALADAANCAGLAFNCSQGTTSTFSGTLANLPTAAVSVYEIAYEVEAPLLKDLRFAQNLSLNSAVRYTKYSTSGVVESWKIGATWQINDSLKLRAVRSRDIRAPNLYELYQPETVNRAASFSDRLTDVAIVAGVAQNGLNTRVTNIAGGNPDLKPEIAQTTTAGVVYTPAWVPGRFSISADAYYIDIAQAIYSQSGTSAQSQSACNQSGGTAVFCSLIIRPNGPTNTAPSNVGTVWYTRVINVADFKTYGFDFEANEALDIFDNPFTARALVQWVPHVVTCFPGSPCADTASGSNVSLGGGPSWAQPKVRASLFLRYKLRGFDLGLQERWRSALTWNPGTALVYSTPGPGPQAYTDVNFGYTFTNSKFSSAQAFVSIKNLFNTPPQPSGAAAAQIGDWGGFVLGDDGIGRFFSVGVRVRR